MKQNTLISILAAMLLLTLPLGLWAVPCGNTVPDNVDSVASTRLPDFSLLIAAPGYVAYELEGHAGMRVNTGQPDGDFVVNWGLFEFSRPNFAYHFVKGETDYNIGIMPTSLFIWQYANQNRRITEMKLNLTDAEKLRLLEHLNIELSEGHNVYRYNYVKDNCVTRPIEAIEIAVGDTMTNMSPSPLSGTTYREVMTHYHRNYPWYQFGIDLALGTGVDYQISNREKLFAPVEVPIILAGSTIGTDSLGNPRKVLGDPYILSSGDYYGIPEPPTPWYLTPMFIFWLLFAIGAVICIHDLRQHRISAWFTSTVYFMLTIGGVVVAFLVFVSTHEATSPNWNLLWLNPLTIIPAICIWLKKAKKLIICYQIANFGAILCVAAIAIIGIQSFNPAILPLLLLDAMLAATYIKLNQW